MKKEGWLTCWERKSGWRLWKRLQEMSFRSAKLCYARSSVATGLSNHAESENTAKDSTAVCWHLKE